MALPSSSTTAPSSAASALVSIHEAPVKKSVIFSGQSITKETTDQKGIDRPDQKNSGHPTTPKSILNKDSLENLRNRLAAVSVKVMQEIAADTQRRLEGFQKKPKLLKKGVFYANEYYREMAQLASTSPKIASEVKTMKEAGQFFHGYADSKFFSIQRDARSETGYSPLAYELKKDMLPSEALIAFQKGLTFTDCGQACNFAYYKALLQVLGSEKFNAIFAANSETPLRLSDRTLTKSLGLLLVQPALKNRDELKIGQRCRIQGTSLYGKKHLFGEGANFNVLCIDDKPNAQKFVGLGLSSAGMTQEQICAVLVDEYNKEDLGFKIFPTHVFEKIFGTGAQEPKKDSNPLVLDLKLLKESGGGVFPANGVYDFDLSKIVLLEKNDVKTCRQLMNAWLRTAINRAQKQMQVTKEDDTKLLG